MPRDTAVGHSPGTRWEGQSPAGAGAAPQTRICYSKSHGNFWKGSSSAKWEEKKKKKGLGVGPVLKRKKEETNVIDMHEEVKLFNL